MNKNNLSWVDNKIFGNPGSTPNITPPMRPYMDTAPAQYQAGPIASAPSAVSPATYQDTAAKAPAPSGVSPATYQDIPAKAPTPTGVSPASYQDMTPNNSNQTGLSPAQYQMDPVVYPVQSGQMPPVAAGMGMPGTLTRDVTYGSSPLTVQGPPTVLDSGYIPAYLKSQLGKRVRAEFNIGTNLYTDRTGILKEVGFSYFVLEDNVTHAMVMCDLYSLKFLTSL